MSVGLRRGEREHVVDEPVHPVELAQRRLDLAPALAGILLVLEQLELAAQDRQRRSQLVRGVRDEVALTAERQLEPVEHAIEGVGEHADLVPAPTESAAPAEVAGLDARGDRRHPPQRPRYHRRRQPATAIEISSATRPTTMNASLSSACASSTG